MGGYPHFCKLTISCLRQETEGFGSDLRLPNSFQVVEDFTWNQLRTVKVNQIWFKLLINVKNTLISPETHYEWVESMFLKYRFYHQISIWSVRSNMFLCRNIDSVRRWSSLSHVDLGTECLGVATRHWEFPLSLFFNRSVVLPQPECNSDIISRKNNDATFEISWEEQLSEASVG